MRYLEAPLKCRKKETRPLFEDTENGGKEFWADWGQSLAFWKQIGDSKVEAALTSWSLKQSP